MKQKTYLNKDFGESLKEVLSDINPDHIFIVAKKGSYQKSGAKAVCSDILKSKKVTHFDAFGDTPNIKDIQSGIDKFNKSDTDVIIAIGGGNVIDTAKAINILSVIKDENIIDYVLGKKIITQKGVPLVAVPTTAGSGSEATHFAVVYVENIKHSLVGESILPDFSIIDPVLTYSLPASITASSGLDVLAQSIESYWSICSTSESKEYSRKAMILSIKFLEEVVKIPSPESRAAMSEAAHYAGKAINISKTTAPHAMSYPLTRHFGIAHGHAVALTLSYILNYNASVSDRDVVDTRGAGYVKEALDEIITLLGCSSVLGAQDLLKSLVCKVGLKTRLSDFGVKKSDIDLFLGEVSSERIGNNPRALSRDFIKDIYIDIL